MSRKNSQTLLYQWRISVMKLDSWTCQNVLCQLKAIEVHHIIYRSQDKSLIYNINNGIALCPECHYKVHNGFDLNGRRVTGRDFMIDILEQHKKFEYFRWRYVLEELIKRKDLKDVGKF